jgi:hypothetical protein
MPVPLTSIVGVNERPQTLAAPNPSVCFDTDNVSENPMTFVDGADCGTGYGKFRISLQRAHCSFLTVASYPTE